MCNATTHNWTQGVAHMASKGSAARNERKDMDAARWHWMMC